MDSGFNTRLVSPNQPSRINQLNKRRSISADSLPGIRNLQIPQTTSKGGDLLTTTISKCTKEILEQATKLDGLLGKIQEGKITQELYDASKILIEKINSLLIASSVFVFQVTEKSSQTKKESISSDHINKMQNACAIITQLCYEPSLSESLHKLYRTTGWQQKELYSLKEQLKIFISSMNKIFSGTAFPYLKLHEKTVFKKLTDKIEKKKYRYQLNCIFLDEKHMEQWEKVKNKVNAYFNKFILIDLQAELSSQIALLLAPNESLESPMSNLIAQRLLLMQKKHIGMGEEKDIQTDLERNHIQILDIYQTRLLNLAKSLKTPNYPFLSAEHKADITGLRCIFKECLNDKYTDELETIFFSTISDSLIINYIELLLETYNVEKIATMLAGLKKEGAQKSYWDYASIEASHWDRLVELQEVSEEEMKRALMGGQIEIRDQNGNVLLNRPDSISGDDPEKTKKIDAYLLLTEQCLSRHIGDPSGTLLKTFREICYPVLQKNSQEREVQTPQTREEESILNKNHQIFTVFAPLIKKMGENLDLTSEEQDMFTQVENRLQESHFEIMNKYGIKKIAKLLFSFHRILNQSFMIGTLSILKNYLNHIYPNDKQGIKSLSDKNVNPAWLFVELGENEKIAFEWIYTNQLYSEKWLFTYVLRIELPPIDSDGQRGKITQEFKFRPQNSQGEVDDIEEKMQVLQRVSKIRLVLKAMKFPNGSFIEEMTTKTDVIF
jgi:hypothetical protein